MLSWLKPLRRLQCTNGFETTQRHSDPGKRGGRTPVAGRWLAVGPTVTNKPSQGVQEDAEAYSRVYPSDFDYYRDVVANNAPSGLLGIPHRQSGELIMVDLFDISAEDLVEKCGIPENQQEVVLDCYRTYLLGRIPYWDESAVPEHIPLLDE